MTQPTPPDTGVQVAATGEPELAVAGVDAAPGLPMARPPVAVPDAPPADVPADPPARAATFTAVVCGMPGDNTLLVVEWVMLACRSAGHVARAVPLGGGSDRPHGMFIEIAADVDGEETLVGTPAGPVDLVVAGEHLELLRAVRSGYSSPDRTTIVASCRRALTDSERVASPANVLREHEVGAVAAAAAARYIAFDAGQVAGWYSLPGRVQPSLLTGAVAAAEVLPVTADQLGAAMVQLDIEPHLHLQGLRRGRPLGRRAGGRARRTMTAAQFVRKRSQRLPRGERGAFEQLIVHVDGVVAPDDRSVVREAVLALTEFQSAAYARQLVEWVVEVRRAADRAGAVPAVEGMESIPAMVARNLVAMMVYPDLVWVAHVKSRRTRLQQVRREHGIGRDQDYSVTDLLPVDPAEREHAKAMGLVARRRTPGAMPGHLSAPVRVERVDPTTPAGALRLRRLRALRAGREASPRHQVEMDCAAMYVLTVREALEASPELGRIVAESGSLVHGAGAVRAAHRATATAYWGRVVRQALAIDRAAGVEDATVSRIIVPFVWDELCRSGPLALWEHAGRVVGIALHCSRGGSHADAIGFACRMVGDVPIPDIDQ